MSSLSTKPNLQKLIHDIQECVNELKRQCNESGTPIDDDNKTLQRLCAKLEYLLQHEQIDHSSFLGGRKDYWNYICDGLSSTKGVRDGLKYVKTLSELKTSLGRGRAFIRFALTYQHLADSLQQCVNDQKLTREWYTPASVWLNEDQCRFLISVLYDLNDVRFDLGAKGYDLDNGWPLFARHDIPAHKWNVALSRTSSIGSLSSSYNDSSLKMDPVPFVLPPASLGGGIGSSEPDGQPLHEVEGEADESPEERLTRELDQSELICGDLAVRVGELEGLLQAADRAKEEAAARRDSADERSGALESRCAELERRVHAASEEVAALRQLQVQHDRLASDCEQLTRERERLHSALSSESARHREAEERLQQELRSLESRLAASDGGAAELSLALKMTVEEGRLCAKRRDDSEAELERVTAQLADAQAMNARLHADLQAAAAAASTAAAEAAAPLPPTSHSDPRLVAFNLSASVKELLRAECTADLPALCTGLAARVADGVVTAMFINEAADGGALCAAAAAAERDAVESAIKLFVQRLQGEVDATAAAAAATAEARAAAATDKATAADALLRLATEDKAGLQRTVDDLTARLRQSAEDLAAVRGALDESSDALRRVEVERDSLGRLLSAAADEAKRADEARERALRETTERLQRVERERDAAADESAERLRRALDDREGALHDLQRAVEVRDALARTAEVTAAELTKTEAAARDDAHRRAEADAVAEAEHRRTVAGLTEENARLDAKLTDLRLLVERLQRDADASRLRAQNEAQDAAHAAMGEERERSAAELSAERRCAAERESALQAQLDARAAEAGELQQRSLHSDALIEELRSRTRDLDERLAAASERLRSVEAECAAAVAAERDARVAHEAELSRVRTLADAAASEALAARRGADEARAERERTVAEAALALDAARAEHAVALEAARAEHVAASIRSSHEHDAVVERLRAEHAAELERAIAAVRDALSRELDEEREVARRSREAHEAAAERTAATLAEMRSALGAAETARAAAQADRDRALDNAAAAGEEARAAVRSVEAAARQESESAAQRAAAALLEANMAAEKTAQEAAAAALRQLKAEREDSEAALAAALRDARTEREAAAAALRQAEASFDASLREKETAHAAAVRAMEVAHVAAVEELAAVHAATREEAAARHETALAEAQGAALAARHEAEMARAAALEELSATRAHAATKARADGEALAAIRAEVGTLQALLATLRAEAEEQRRVQASALRRAANETESALKAARTEAADLRADLERTSATLGDLRGHYAAAQQALERQNDVAVLEAEKLATALAARDDALSGLDALQRVLDERTLDWQRLEESGRRECEEASRCVRQAAEERDSAVVAVRRQLDDAVHSAELLAADLERATARSVALETERDQATASLEVVSHDFGELKEMLRSLKQTEVDKSAELARLQVELERTRKEFERSHATTEQQIAALKFQLSSQQLECEVAIEGYRTQHAEVLQLSDVLTRQEQLINALESELQSIREEKSFEHDLHLQQLQDLNQEMTAKDEERHANASFFDTVHAELENERQARRRLQDELVGFKLAAGEQAASKENELHQLREENADLRRKLVKLIRDKDNLWQKTDALVYRQKQKAEVKWMDDSVTTNCIACSARFSLTLRKHHCRLCGRIFCHNCSNNWVSTASSSRKARACNGCYADHDPDGSLNSSLLESSALTNGADDDDDDRTGKGDDGSSAGDGLADGSSSSVANGDTNARPPRRSDHAATQPVAGGSWPASGSQQSSAEGSGGNSRRESESCPIPLSTGGGGGGAGGSSSSNGASLVVSTTSQQNSPQPSAPFTTENQVILESKQVDLLAGGAITVPLPIDVAETTLFWEFSSSPKGVAFSVTYMPSRDSTDEEEVLVPLSRCNSHREAVRGHLIAHLTGVYVFTFDNASSRSSDKTVTYTFRIASP